MAKQRYDTDALMSQIGARIRFLRLETGLSLRVLAQKSKCSASAIMRIELGRSAISGKLLHNIACGLHVRPFELLNFDTQHDDLGYVVEKMRQAPEARAKVNALLAARAKVNALLAARGVSRPESMSSGKLTCRRARRSSIAVRTVSSPETSFGLITA